LSEREGSQRERGATTAVVPEGRGQHRREERALTEREEPVLRVVRGEPTDEELAALIAVLAARAGAARASTVDSPRRTSAWNAPAARLRRPLHPGPDAWRRSALPG
jgi:hypothetical protein